MLAEDKFCPSCAAALEAKEVAGRQRPVCPQCSRVVYYDPKVAAASIIEREGKVLMVKRAIEPGYGLWSRDTNWGNEGYVSDYGYDYAQTSFHILTTDGIRGRDLTSD